jgi:DnaJ-class molecular chaperone
MRNFYSVLRVTPKASDAEIKAAFRNMAKTCHPDMKPGDSEAEAAFQEVKRAYTFLSNPETRKAYDQFLAGRRAVERRRFRRAAATMSASFVLTAVTVFVAMVWVQHGGLPAAHELADGPGRGSTVEVVRASPPGHGEDPRTGSALRAGTKAPGQRSEAVTERPTGP